MPDRYGNQSGRTRIRNEGRDGPAYGPDRGENEHRNMQGGSGTYTDGSGTSDRDEGHVSGPEWIGNIGDMQRSRYADRDDNSQRKFDPQSDRGYRGRPGRDDDPDYYRSTPPRGRGYDRSDKRSDRGFMDRASDEVSSWFGDDDAERRREADHRGRGPKGYQRSDTRIEEDINDRLTEDPDIDPSDIEIKVDAGEVTLDGTVDSKRAKRHAEDCCDSVSGVKHVQNNLRVKDKNAEGATPSTGL